MYDAITTRYTFSCPERGEARVALSSFRRVEQLPGPAQPAVFGIEFGCTCGHEHPGLVSHDDLDWAPLGLGLETTFVNLMTATVDPVESELADLAARRIQAGEWPWSFFCYAEERPRPVFPSAFVVLAPSGGGEEVGVLAPTSSRRSTSTCRSTTTARSGSWNTCSPRTPSVSWTNSRGSCTPRASTAAGSRSSRGS